MALLKVIDLEKIYPGKGGLLGSGGGPVRAVDGVSFEVEEGEILGLVGESGCGKTTLSRLIMQLIRPTAGNIILNGHRLDNLTGHQVREYRIDFQMIFQDPYASLNPRMTVYSALAEAVRVRHRHMGDEEVRVKVIEHMRRVGLDPKFLRKYPHEFSGGQRQRIAIARALAPEPRLVIADEPVSALDVSIQSQILNLLRKLRHDLRLTMIFISHDLKVVRYIADRVCVMKDGKIVEVGDANEVFENPQHDYTKQLISAIPQISHVS